MHAPISTFQHLPKRQLQLAALALVTLLAACRMPIVIEGDGFLFAAESGEVYSDGYVFDINEDFQQTFWPVPAPGHYFQSWNAICSGGKFLECPLNLTEEAWGQEEEVPLDATFTAGYTGPMALVDYQYYIESGGRRLVIPVNTVQLQGNDPNAPIRAFAATPGMNIIIPGQLVRGNYEFELPLSDYTPDDFWLMLSTLDRDGTLATVSYDFGIAESLNPVTELRPHSNASPYKDVLVNCAAASNPHAVCPMQKLPYIGAVTNDPNISDIMKRVVVSHGWMGNRFAEVLRNLPPEMLKMFRGVTAIVIGSDIRPAFFTVLTGAIYIDPQYLWLTQAERDSIDWTPDYRSDFGNALKFIPAGGYLIGRYFAWSNPSDYPEGSNRNILDIIWPLGYLIAHELAHANDAMHPAIMPPASSPLTPLDFYFRLGSQDASTSLSNTYPLSSQLLYSVGRVLYRGEEASDQILNLTARDVGNAFALDSANGMYSYSSTYEDTATLVEEVLMSYFFGLDKLQSFLEVPAQEPQDCTDYILQWGSLNRVSTPMVKERARLVLSTILDEADVSRYLDAVPSQRLMRPGVSLCENLEILFPSPPQELPGQFREISNMPSMYSLEPRHEQLQDRARTLKERRTRIGGETER